MFMFNHLGMLRIEAEGLDENTVMEDALEAGAEDFALVGSVFEISTQPNDLGAVRDALDRKGYKFVSAEVEYIPTTLTSLDEESAVKMNKLIDMLEDNDDVQDVWHNWDAPDEE